MTESSKAYRYLHRMVDVSMSDPDALEWLADAATRLPADLRGDELGMLRQRIALHLSEHGRELRPIERRSLFDVDLDAEF